MRPNSETWDRVAERYADGPSFLEAELANDINDILARLKVSFDDNLLEVGCGSGHLSFCLYRAGYHTDLLDFSRNALDHAKATFASSEPASYAPVFHLQDALNLAHNDDFPMYDVCWNSGVCEHFTDDDLRNLLLGMARHSKKYVIIIYPNPESLIYLLYRLRTVEERQWPYGIEFLRSNYRDIALAAGLDTIEQGFIGSAWTRSLCEVAFPDRALLRRADQLFRGGHVAENQYYLSYLTLSPTKQVDNTIQLLERDKQLQIDRTFYLDALGISNALVDSLERQIMELRSIYSSSEQASLAELNKVRDSLRACVAEAENVQTSLQTKLADSGRVVAPLRAQLNDSERRATSLETQLNSSERLITSLESQLKSSKMQCGALEQQLAAALASRDRWKRRARTVEGSSSWRMTKPLRFIGDTLAKRR